MALTHFWSVNATCILKYRLNLEPLYSISVTQDKQPINVFICEIL